jgi:hypothetical protein
MGVIMNTERNPEPLDEAFDALRRMPAPDRPADADAKLLARLAAGASPAAQLVPLTRRRILMRVTSWSLAATVLVAAGGVFLFGGNPPVLLADVLKAADKHNLVMYTMTQTDETKEGSAVQPLVQTVYADLKAPRSRMRDWAPGSQSGALDFESVFVRDATKNTTMHVITETITEKGRTDPKLIQLLKMFAQNGVPRKEATLSPAFGDLTPATAEEKKSILENFQELEKHKDAVAAKGKLQGKDVLKYRIEEEYKTTILWVDAATKLPVKLEHEITDPKILNPSVTKTKFVLSDFEWDPEVKGFKNLDELFSVIPPEGYKVIDLRQKKDEKAEKKDK